MIKKLFSVQKTSFAAFIIGATTLVSYILGLVRDRMLADKFDVSFATDAYYSAFLVPDMILNLFVAGALTGAFIPIFGDYIFDKKKDEEKLANIFLTYASLITIVVGGLMFLFAPQIIFFVFSENSIEQNSLIVDLTRILLISPVLFALSNTFGGILMSRKRFMSYALSPVLYNLGIILGIIFLSDQYGIYGMVWGSIFGLLMHLLIRLIDCMVVGYRFKPSLDFKDPGFLRIIKLMIPKTIGLVSIQINLWTYTIYGVLLVEGSIAAFNLARNFQSFPVSLFGIALAVAVFPYLSENVSTKNTKGFIRNLDKTLRQSIFLTLPSAIGMAVLASPFLWFVLGSGKFDENSLALTTLALLPFTLSIVFESVVALLARAFYAHKEVTKPTIFAFVGMAVNVAFVALFYQNFEVATFGFGWFLFNFVQVILLGVYLRRFIKDFPWRKLFNSIAKIVFACAMMVLGIYLVPLFGLGGNLMFLVQVLVGSVVYLGVAYIIGCSEIESLERIFKFLKFKKK